MKDETIIHCPDGHPCDWREAEEPDRDTNDPGAPPAWVCEECEWESSEYASHAEYVQVRREERIESQLGYTL